MAHSERAALQLRRAVQLLIDPKPVTSTKRTANANPSAGDDTAVDCPWCTKRFTPRRGGTRQRFCSVRCRMAFWSALRRWGEAALTAGTLTIDAIRNADPGACTLPHRAKSPPPVPEAGLPSSAAPEAMARVVVDLPKDLIKALVFRHFELRFGEQDDLAAVMAALHRVGYKPAVTRL